MRAGRAYGVAGQIARSMRVCPVVLLASLGAACGNEAERQSPASGEAETASGGEASTASSPAAHGGEQASTASSNGAGDGVTIPDFAGDAAEAVERFVGQIEPLCRQALDECGATPGCPEILTCAASTGCSGRECRCADEACEVSGPCRSVIESAPGADAGDGAGPAAAAAARVGVCVAGLPLDAGSDSDGG